MAAERKSVEALTKAAFDAGVKFGAGYPATEAIPTYYRERAFADFKDEWTGRPEDKG